MTEHRICPKHECKLVPHANGIRGGKPRIVHRCPSCRREAKLKGWATYRAHERKWRPSRPRPPRNKERDRERLRIRRAIQSGRLTPEDCNACGLSCESKNIAGRRLVYATFQEPGAPITWLCARCAGIKRQRIAPESLPR